jgi:hypothetical protein
MRLKRPRDVMTTLLSLLSGALQAQRKRIFLGKSLRKMSVVSSLWSWSRNDSLEKEYDAARKIRCEMGPLIHARLNRTWKRGPVNE